MRNAGLRLKSAFFEKVLNLIDEQDKIVIWKACTTRTIFSSELMKETINGYIH